MANDSDLVDSEVHPSLVLVGTPLGNLQDLSPRARQVLQDCHLLVCEDTRRTSILLQALKIQRRGPVLSYHDHSSTKSLEAIKDHWAQGHTVAYATDGGMPSVSDPGYTLVKLARALGVTVTTAPGPTAVTTLFSLSGLPSPKFLFHGFFPRTKGEIEKVLDQIRSLGVAHVFYEAPSRLVATFELLERHLPQAEALLGRELTKIHEQICSGSVESVVAEIKSWDRVRGECVLAIMGGTPEAETNAAHDNEPAALKPLLAPHEPDAAEPPLQLSETQQEELTALLKAGMGSKEAAKVFGKKYGFARRSVYDFIVRRLT